MNKIILTLMFAMLLVGTASAYLPHEKDTTLNFSITSNFATSCELTTINTPTGIIEIGQTDISTGTFNFNVLSGNFTSLGTYCMNIVCTDGTDITTGEYCREITSDGFGSTQTKQDNYYILFIGIALLFGFILGAGLIISYYPSGIENKFITDILSIINYGVAFLCLAMGIYNWLPNDN